MMKMSKFFHRKNRDSTIDSICTQCFMTIATGNSHDDLIGAEVAHDCTPLTLRKHWESSTGADAANCPQAVNEGGKLPAH
jgi:hypothetical protein